MSERGLLFHAALRPRRGLSTPAAKKCLLALLLWVGIPAVGFAIAGAWPVLGFLGLEVILLIGAITVYFRRAQTTDIIEVHEHALTLRRIDARGKLAAETTIPPHWAQVSVEEPVGGQGHILIQSHGTAYRLGHYLAPDERTALAGRLRDALGRVRV